MTEVCKEPDKHKPFFHSDKEQSRISILGRIDCLQRAVAAVRGQQAEHGENMAEVKQQLYRLGKNKEWIRVEGGIF